MANKQTAVEWLVEQIYASPEGPTPAQFDRILRQAKEMEKQQIIDANTHGFSDGINYEKYMPVQFASSLQYYNKTFKSE